VDYAHANGIKFLICAHNYVNGWNWQIAASAFGNNRTALVNHLAGLVTQWNADGVDIDFEGNEAGDPNRAEFGTFIRELGTRLHSMNKELTVDIFPYIWNQPSMNWIGDWVGSVDGINSMGYDGLSGGGCGEVWQPYRWQQDSVLAAGYKCHQFDMGMPGWTGTWGCGGLGTGTLAHVNELRSGNYNRQPTSIAIWDAQFNGAGWLSSQVWDGLHAIRQSTCP
jgi:glycosyl hydrolase family 18 (putative chitinase)